jgi:hypothetical protein
MGSKEVEYLTGELKIRLGKSTHRGISKLNLKSTAKNKNPRSPILAPGIFEKSRQETLKPYAQ